MNMSQEDFFNEIKKIRETFDKYAKSLEKQNESLRESLKERDEKIDELQAKLDAIEQSNKHKHDYFKKIINNDKVVIPDNDNYKKWIPQTSRDIFWTDNKTWTNTNVTLSEYKNNWIDTKKILDQKYGKDVEE